RKPCIKVTKFGARTRKGCDTILKHRFDYHVHSDASSDCRVPLQEQVVQGIALGLEVICFTDHLDLDPDDYHSRLERPGDPRSGFLDIPAYYQSFCSCQELYGDRLTLLWGVEIGEAHRFPALATSQLQHPYDMVIASVHKHRGMDISIPWTSLPDNIDSFYRDYFTSVLHLVTKGDFDILAHLDAIKRFATQHFGPFDPTPHREVLAEIFRHLVAKGQGLEVNTSGWRQPPQEALPGLQILRWYKECGGEIITIGSDSHRLPHLGLYLDEGRELAQAAGFKAFVTYRQRTPQFHSWYE
ncbi:MAG: histidinol-phosphatase HisJ family protein, partial [Symbiobacteriaceae bacterium]|nr:histidinol-phosphatase HisJ family protein [Symbiobacteriaceae bacterium]